MYLHLGQNVVVPESTVIGVFDLDNTTGSKITRDFLSNAEKTGNVISVSEDLPKSFVVCGEKRPVNDKLPANTYDDFRIYLSQLSSQTLLKRSEIIMH